MIDINELFPTAEFTSGELMILAETMSTPVVKKYLKSEATNLLAQIGQGQPDPGESDEAYLRRAAEVRGMIIVLQKLLRIENPNTVKTVET